MLSYRHAFHAGNDADVIKHVALCALFAALGRKDKPFLYLETHAGAGTYNLDNRLASQTHEASTGIGMLWGRTFRDAPPAFTHYLDFVRQFNAEGRLRRYPGSPWLARALLRPQDRAVFAELHPVDHGKLVRLARGEPRCTVVQEDGYGLLRSQLPPIERRALVFIDPPYETQDELQRLHGALTEGRKRFANGVYAVWYPVGTKHAADTIVSYVARAARSGARPSKTVDLRWERTSPHTRTDGTPGMQGCGLVIVNPPFGFEETLQQELAYAAAQLEPGRRGPAIRLEWPVPESA
jgi:23S rRNA (adenine2030-N6)-methyltransferase